MSRDLYPKFPVLVVDDNTTFLDSVETTLFTGGIINVECCSDSKEVMPRLKNRRYSVILLDLIMPPPDGKELLPKIVENHPHIPVIVVTGHGDEKTAVACMKNGAFYYLTKPFKEPKELIKIIKDALDLQAPHGHVINMKKDLFSNSPGELSAFSGIITESEKMVSIFQTIVLIAVTSNPVLIRGETGVGKELIARSIHKCSQRKGNFVTVNIAGEDDQFFSDTLFGHKKGGFTDAYRDRKGLIEQAEDGTIFLDEIGDLPLRSQIKLLRLIQEGEYYPLGAEKPQYSNARIVAATNKDLLELQRTGKFRQDLYYRLETHNIYIPPLREHAEDIKPLVDYFLEKAASELNKKTPSVPQELFLLLKNYAFPGNIRELVNMVNDAVARQKSGILSLDVFHEKTQSHTTGSPNDNETLMDKKVNFAKSLPTITELEEIYIKEVMKRAEGNQSMAARLAGMSRKAFAYRLKKQK